MSDQDSPSPTPTPTPDTPDRAQFRVAGPDHAPDAGWIHLSWFGRTQITSIQVMKVQFTSGNTVLLDNNSDFEDTGNAYPSPEWQSGAGASKPTSYVKKTPVSVLVSFQVQPADADPTDCEVTGTFGPHGELTFKVNASFQGGTVQVTAVSSALSDSVNTLRGNIQWSVFSLKDGRFNAGTSTGHVIYVTFGTPSGSNVTEKRVAWVTSAAVGKSTDQDCVDAIFTSMLQFHYTLGATPPDPPWKILGGDLADCGLLADCFRLACLMLGVPDNFQKGFIYPLIAKGGAKFSTGGSDNETRSLSGAHQTRHGNQEKIGWQDHSGGKNNFEGCIKWSSTFYCIGEAKYSTPEAAMTAMVVLTFWGDMSGGGGVWKIICKNPGPFPVATW